MTNKMYLRKRIISLIVISLLREIPGNSVIHPSSLIPVPFTKRTLYLPKRKGGKEYSEKHRLEFI